LIEEKKTDQGFALYLIFVVKYNSLPTDNGKLKRDETNKNI